MNSVENLFAPQAFRARKSCLFEVVQTVAAQLGQYREDSGVYYDTKHFFSCRGYYFKQGGLKVSFEDRKLIVGPEYPEPMVNASVEFNGGVVYDETRNLPGRYGYSFQPEFKVKTCEPGKWEQQLWNFYEQAMHLKARKEERKDALRQRIRSAGNPRSASLFPF